jgi:RimJ/RimL family protein N-acetyltransferase
MEAVSLRQLSRAEALDMVEGRCTTKEWADDFPTEVDVVLARLTLAADVTPTAWSAPWLMVSDGVVVGMLGFKGAPRAGQIEVGYGVAPSCQGRGVATAALRALLDLIRMERLVVRADTAAWNLASQGVLRRLGFVETGRSSSLEDGELINWQRSPD